MFAANMPSPGPFVKSLDLRKSAAAVISALEINPSEASAEELSAFFTYCADASKAAYKAPAKPTVKAK